MRKKAVLHFLKGYLLLLICVLITFVLFYVETFHLFESRQLSLSEQMLQTGTSQFESQINHLSHIALSLSRDLDYLAYSHTSAEDLRPADYVRLVNLQADFSRLCLAQPMISDCGILYRSGVQLTQKRLYIPIDDAYGTFIRFGDMTLAEYMEAFTRFHGTTRFLPVMSVMKYVGPEEASPTYPALIWLCKLSRGNTEALNDVLYATFPLSTLNTLFLSAPGFTESNSGYRLCDASGRTLATYGLAPEDGGDCHVIASRLLSDSLGITLYISNDLFADMMSPVRNMLFLCFGAVLLTGVAVSIMIAGQASRPLYRLLNLVDELDPSEANAGHGGFERIGSTVQNLASSVEEYRATLQIQQEKVRDHVFEELLHETPVPESAVSIRHLKEFQLYFPHFPSRYMMALMLLPKDQVNELPRNQVKLQSMLESFFSPAPYVYMSGFYAIAIFDAALFKNGLATLAKVRGEAMQNGTWPLLMALSEEADSPAQLHALFVSARHMIHMAEQESDRDLVEVWQRKHFPEQKAVIPMDYGQMAQLHNLVLKADKTGARALIHHAFRALVQSSLTDEAVFRQVYYNIRNVLLRVRFEKSGILDRLEIPDFSSQLEYRTQQERLEGCCDKMCDCLKPSIEQKRSVFASSLIAYIEEHLSDSALGVRTVSTHFDVSEPTVQKIMRQEKQCSFFEYVEGRRYSIACDLLKNTAQPIAAIAEKCGYNSLNSFYKAFKRLSDTTPAQMRHQLQATDTEK